METTWNESWTEVWSAGHGRNRTYCGIAHTEDGFAVDVFGGDTCIASLLFESRDAAERTAHQLRSSAEVLGSEPGTWNSTLNAEPRTLNLGN